MPKIPDKIEKNIHLFLEDIQSICSLDKVFLYGSITKGKINKNSDIDLAIFSKTANNKNRLNIMTQIFKKIPKYKLDFQPLVFSLKDLTAKDNSFIQKEIKGKGIVLK